MTSTAKEKIRAIINGLLKTDRVIIPLSIATQIHKTGRSKGLLKIEKTPILKTENQVSRKTGLNARYNILLKIEKEAILIKKEKVSVRNSNVRRNKDRLKTGMIKTGATKINQGLISLRQIMKKQIIN